MTNPSNLDRLSLVSVSDNSSISGAPAAGEIMSMNHLFAAVLLFSSPGCPHEEPSCITPTEYVEVLSLIAEPKPLHNDSE